MAPKARGPLPMPVLPLPAFLALDSGADPGVSGPELGSGGGGACEGGGGNTPADARRCLGGRPGGGPIFFFFGRDGISNIR